MPAQSQHRRQAAAVAGHTKRQALSAYSFNELIRLGNARLSKTWALHSATWNFGNEEHYRVKARYGELEFFFPGGQIVTAPAQLIGTYCRESAQFTWGWGDPEWAETGLSLVSRAVREFGRRRRWAPFTQPVVECSQRVAWDFNTLSFLLSKAGGAFEAPVDENLFQYFVFSSPSIHHAPGDAVESDENDSSIVTNESDFAHIRSTPVEN